MYKNIFFQILILKSMKLIYLEFRQKVVSLNFQKNIEKNLIQVAIDTLVIMYIK